MGRRNPATTARFRVILVAIMMAMTMAARADRVNKSSSSYSGGEYWSSVKEDESIREGDHDDFDGGFSSLDGMLQWAIGVYYLANL